MPVRSETFVDGFAQWAGPWETVLNGVIVPPYNQPYGTWGNQPGGASLGGFFQGHERRRIVKIGMQWGTGSYTGNPDQAYNLNGIGTGEDGGSGGGGSAPPYDGTGLALQFYHTPSGAQYDGPWEAYAPYGVTLDCKDMGFVADGVYREYVLPTVFPARGILWFKGFDDYSIPFNGILTKIRVFTDDWTPASAPQGTVRTIAPTGSGKEPLIAGPGAWNIYAETGAFVASSTNKQGWEVAWNGSQFVMKRPLTADPNANYQVVFRE